MTCGLHREACSVERASNRAVVLPQDDGKWLHVKETTEIGEGKM